jgi:hypothetical protein
MPDIKIPEFSTDFSKAARDLADVARDATYVVIGAGVLGVQKVQVHRQELRKRLTDPKATVELKLSDARSDLQQVVQSFDAKVEELIERIEASFAPVEDRLPTQARDLAKQARVQAKVARDQVRSRVIPTA